MKQSQLWLLALLSVLTLVATPALAEEGAGHLTGSWELGMSGINTDDNAARVNEYSSVNASDGVALAPQLNLEFDKDGFVLGIESATMGPRDQQHELSIDAMRVFKLDSSLSVLEHHKDHETLGQLGATMKDSLANGQPSVSTDQIFADPNIDYVDHNIVDPTDPSKVLPDGIANVTLDYDPATAYAQELDNNYIVTRREWKNEAELTIPQLPNVTFKAGARIETREGMEQAIGMSKCDGCHVSAVGKDIDERTEEFTFGATGKFGLLTVDYEYLNRNFNEDANAPTRYYDDATDGNSANLLNYDNGSYELSRTPDSEKETHMLKARLDLPKSTSITASYVKSNVESSKSETQGDYVLLDGNTLKSEYESFAAKLATKFGNNITLSLRGKRYEIDADNNEIYYPARDASALNTTGNLPFGVSDEYVSAEERDVNDIGTDVVIRLAKATTLRLGYEYEEIDRNEDELGDTETNTFKVAFKTRVNNSLSGRMSYMYQDINEPLAGATVGIAQTGYTDSAGVFHPAITNPAYPGLAWLTTADYLAVDNNNPKVWYWNSVYPSRGLDSTSQPDAVHEAKVSTTWAPNANMAATFFMRARYEENDDVKYEQTTLVPGVSFWYAPSDKLNLTMAYTFNNQDTENRACVGWYHG